MKAGKLSRPFLYERKGEIYAMNMEETNQILASITAIYPVFVRDRDARTLAKVWQQVFNAIPYQLVNQALMAYIATDTKGFPPTPGALNMWIAKTQQMNGPTENEAWAMVYRAISRGLYNSREEYEKLPPDIREIVGNSRMLHEWAQMDSSEVNTIIAAGFKRSWRARQELKQELMPLAGIPQKHLGEQEKREF